jgi:hypothetical protein
MTDDLATDIDGWVRAFQDDPRLAEQAAKAVEPRIDLGISSRTVSILMAALGKYRESQPD